MVDFTKTFKSEYDVARLAIATNNNYARDWQPLVRKLETLMGADGFDAAHDEALAELRRKITDGPSQTKITEDKGILEAAAAWTAGDAGTIDAAAKQRAASLKLLRHIYLQNKSGNRRVWICSLPKEFTGWPSAHRTSNAGTTGRVKELLASKDEHFSNQRRFLGNSTQQALAWCRRPVLCWPMRLRLRWSRPRIRPVSRSSAGSPKPAWPRRRSTPTSPP